MAVIGENGKGGVMIRQSDMIFGCLMLSFLFFVTARGELPNYLKVFI